MLCWYFCIVPNVECLFHIKNSKNRAQANCLWRFRRWRGIRKIKHESNLLIKQMTLSRWALFFYSRFNPSSHSRYFSYLAPGTTNTYEDRWLWKYEWLRAKIYCARGSRNDAHANLHDNIFCSTRTVDFCSQSFICESVFGHELGSI